MAKAKQTKQLTKNQVIEKILIGKFNLDAKSIDDNIKEFGRLVLKELHIAISSEGRRYNNAQPAENANALRRALSAANNKMSYYTTRLFDPSSKQTIPAVAPGQNAIPNYLVGAHLLDKQIVRDYPGDAKLMPAGKAIERLRMNGGKWKLSEELLKYHQLEDLIDLTKVAEEWFCNEFSEPLPNFDYTLEGPTTKLLFPDAELGYIAITPVHSVPLLKEVSVINSALKRDNKYLLGPTNQASYIKSHFEKKGIAYLKLNALHVFIDKLEEHDELMCERDTELSKRRSEELLALANKLRKRYRLLDIENIDELVEKIKKHALHKSNERRKQLYATAYELLKLSRPKGALKTFDSNVAITAQKRNNITMRFPEVRNDAVYFAPAPSYKPDYKSISHLAGDDGSYALTVSVKSFVSKRISYSLSHNDRIGGDWLNKVIKNFIENTKRDAKEGAHVGKEHLKINKRRFLSISRVILDEPAFQALLKELGGEFVECFGEILISQLIESGISSGTEKFYVEHLLESYSRGELNG